MSSRQTNDEGTWLLIILCIFCLVFMELRTMATARTTLEIQAEIEDLEADYRAAVTALKHVPRYDPQRAQWQGTVNGYGATKTNLLKELQEAQRGGR